MSRHNIQFKGIRHTPSDITAQDGDLLECVNLVHENGELKPIEMPERTEITGISSKSVNFTLIAVHDISGTKRFVFANYSNQDSTIIVKDGTTATELQEFSIPGEEVKWAETVGNTLVIGTDKSVHYALFKNGQYNWLGDVMPQPVFTFDFERTSASEQGYYINENQPNTFALDDVDEPHPGGGVLMANYILPEDSDTDSATLVNTTNENKTIVRDGIRAKVEAALKRSRVYNRFVFPFFVRYAVRMYDGSHAMHSAPILMIPSSLTNPILAVLAYAPGMLHFSSGGVNSWVAFESVRLRPLGLKMKFKGFSVTSGTLSDWSDIIKGVDIYMSSQISSYDNREWDDIDRFPISFNSFNMLEDGGGSTDFTERDYGRCYSRNNEIDWFDIYGNNIFDITNPTDLDDNQVTVPLSPDSGSRTVDIMKYVRIPLPSVNGESMMKKIQDTSLFYLVKQYDIDELSAAWNSERSFHVEVEKGTIDNLETQPILQDDYISRFKKSASAWYAYNQRLVLGNISLQLPQWYTDQNTYSSNNYDIKICFFIEKQEKTYYVTWQKNVVNSVGIGEYDFGHYLYYPDPDCKKAVIQAVIKGATVTKEVQMRRHDGLNGSYALMPSLYSFYEYQTSLPNGTWHNQSSDLYFHWPNTVAMSKVANPFHLEQFKDIGRSEIIGIAANVLDVSSAQWGQFPVHVFCGDGIFSIDIDREGNMGGVNAVSSDVLMKPTGISKPTLIQTNQVLVFLTKRGVMSVSGTKPQPLSLAMNGRLFTPTSDLKPTSPTASVLLQEGAFPSLITAATDSVDFKTFAASGYLAYDYAHNRVLLLNSNKDYQYVLSMDTMTWSKLVAYTNGSSIQIAVQVRTLPTIDVSHMKAAVNNYTEMYLQDSASYLYKTMDVSGENASGSSYRYGYFISRPVRFGTDEYKTVTRLLHRYTHYAANSFAKVAIYGSRDGENYGRLNTLRGMGYQYFIFVVYTYLKPNERYSYMSVDFEPRLTNKLR